MARSSGIHRVLDAAVGVPLVALVSLFRRKRRIPAEPRRIGVLSPTAIGDLILSSGLLLHLRSTFPEAEIHLFHGPSNAAIVGLLPVDVIAHRCNFKSIGKAVATLRRARLDILIDLTPWTRATALCTGLSGTLAVGYHAERQLRHFAFDRAVLHRSDRHETENLRSVAEVFAPCAHYVVRLKTDLPLPPMALPLERLVVLHTVPGGSRAEQKSWPLENWAELARRLAQRGYVVAFSGTRADSPYVDAVLARAGLPEISAFSLCGRLSLAELAGLLRRARLLITIDTGVLHLASALDVNMVALHGPTRSWRWGALSPRAISLDAPHPEAGYIHFGFETSAQDMQIMPTLSVDLVESAALRAMRPANAPAAVPVNDRDLPSQDSSSHSPPHPPRET